MTRKWPLIGLVLAVLWLFVRGVELAVGRIVGEFIIGLLVGMPIAFSLRRLYAEKTALRPSLQVVPAAVVYVVLFVWELLTANVDVARRVLSPSMPIEPTVVEVPLRVKSDVAITTIANSITLTPGTLSMDYDPARNVVYVHAIAGRGNEEEAVIAPIRRWEDYALRIFREERAPGDPVPDPDRVEERRTGDEDADAEAEATGPEAADTEATGPGAGGAGGDPGAVDERAGGDGDGE